MESEQITVNSTDREYKKKRVEELGSTLSKIRARVKANRGSSVKNEDEVQPPGGSKHSEDSERTALTQKLEEDRVRFSKHQSEKAKIKEAMDQIMIDREEQKKVEKQLQETIAKVTAPAPELPPLIKQRIMDLETTVETLKERLSEKDKVLSSKSQALTVLHNQLMQRSQEHAERAMTITQEISTLKENFGKREDNWKKELHRLRCREEELENRLSEKESHVAEVELLQEELMSVKQTLSDATNRNEEISNKLENLNKINLKLKAQLKAVKQERDKFQESLGTIEDMETLKNRIIFLEEEKESLQLAETKSVVIEEEMIKLRESLRTITDQKEALQKDFDESKIATEQQLEVVKQLKLDLKKVEEQKISAEMRSIELEEKLEVLFSDKNKEIEQLLNEISLLKGRYDEQNLIIESLNNQLSLKNQEMVDIKGKNFPVEVETEIRLMEIESYNNKLMKKIKELRLKCEEHEQAVIQLNETLSERNNTICQLQSKYDQTLASLNETCNIKEILEKENERLKVVEMSIKKEKHSNDGVMASAELKEDVNLAQKFKKLAANYKIRTRLCQELEEKLKIANDMLEEKNEMIAQLSQKEVELKMEIDSLKCKEEGFGQELDNVKTKNCKLLAIIEDLTPKLEALEAERSAALINVDKMNRAFEELKEWKEGDSKLLKQHVTSVNSMANHVLLLEDELGKLQSIVNEKNSVIGELETERKKLVEDMKNSEVELERLRALYQQESIKNQNVLTNLQGLENEMLVSREEMNQIAEQLDAVTKNYNMCLGNLQERENYIEALEQDIVGMKSKMYNLESGIEDKHRMLQERGNQLSAKLEEAEILRHSYDKYQVEVEKKFQLMEENEKSLKNSLFELQTEIQFLKNSNSELLLEKVKMSTEITNLNDIRNSYNSTLDRIEVLNEELKQVMDDFEAKNMELMKLGEERTELLNKLTDLEEAYAEAKSQLAESECVYKKLKDEFDGQNYIVTELRKEISNQQTIIGELKSKQSSESKSSITTDDEAQLKNEQSVMFSWDQHSIQPIVKDDDDGLRFELEEKKKSLEAAHQEIGNLQSTMDSIMNKKNNEILSLKEQINKLLCNNSASDLDLKSPSNENFDQKEQDVRVFSWDQHSQEAGKDDEDGWGWIGAEAHLEQDHKHSEALQIQNLTQRVKELEEEQKGLTDKLGASKIKCVKLLKKLKETEALNEQSRVERNVGFSDLDFALQEELRLQLDQLEGKNKELTAELNSLKLEKENLLKRVDVLSTANDQLVDMKERQDIEVQMWQKRSSELKNELQGLQWTIEELKFEMPSLNKDENELSEKFNVLVAENEELQRIICNLKDGRPIGSSETTLELNSLKEEVKKLKEIRLKEKENFENETKKANEEIDAMEQQIDMLSKENRHLNETFNHSVSSKNDEISYLQDQIQKLSSDKKKLEEQISSLNDNMIGENQKTEFQVQLSNADEEIRLLKSVIDEKSKENDDVKMHLVEMKKETDCLLEKIQFLGIENSKIKEKLKLYSEELTSSQTESEIIDDLSSLVNRTKNELTTLQNMADLLTSNNANQQEQAMRKPEAFEINLHLGNWQKSCETIKDLGNELKCARGHIDDLETYIDDLIFKLQVPITSNNSAEKLKEAIVAVSCQLNKKSDLEKEISALREEISKHTNGDSRLENINSSLPVFKGFSVTPNDPFESITEKEDIHQLGATNFNSETEEFRLIISKLQYEKTLYQSEITHLQNHLDHLTKINTEFAKQTEEMKLKLERSEAEIHHWREQANVLNIEIHNLVTRHNEEKEDLKRNEEGSKEKLLEIEENYQNTLLNKEQEKINLKKSLLEKEQQLANSVNELNSLQTQYGLVTQQLFSLENRVRDLTKENEELHVELNKSKREENTIIEKQKAEIQDLMAKLEYLSQSQNISKEERNTEHLKLQLNELHDHLQSLEISNNDFQKIISNQSEEISRLKENLVEQDSRRIYLESLITQKQSELEEIRHQPENQETLHSNVNNEDINKYITLIKQKNSEIERVSKVLFDTQERLVHVQDSKPHDKLLSLQVRLDQALYALHISDVRCTELTQEISQLLEERDSLQLRLSECLRENEILRKGNANNSSAPSPELKNKLGELHKGYMRDPVVQLEMESRHNQQMNLYSQEEESKEEKDTTVDYGFFNWFFSSPTATNSVQQ